MPSSNQFFLFLKQTATFGGRKEIVHFLLSQNVDTEVEDIKSR